MAIILAESETVCTLFSCGFLTQRKAASGPEGDTSNATVGPFSKPKPTGTLTSCYRGQLHLVTEMPPFAAQPAFSKV